MIRRILAISTLVAIALSGAAAQAHKDYNPDGDNNSTKRCDTWYRTGHQTGSGATQHSEDHKAPDYDYGDVGYIPQKQAGVPAGAETGVYVHSHTGHYVVRHDAFYVEVVGGGGYNRGGNQGGYVQFEADPAAGAPDVDGHVDFFAGTAGSLHAEDACVSVADRKVGDQGTQLSHSTENRGSLRPSGSSSHRSDTGASHAGSAPPTMFVKITVPSSRRTIATRYGGSNAGCGARRTSVNE